MFASHEKSVGKKTFQKPNILRRKPKVSIQKPNKSNIYESPDVRSLVTPQVEKVNIPDQSDKTAIEGTQPANLSTVWKLILPNNCEEKNSDQSQEIDKDANINSKDSVGRHNTEIKDLGTTLERSSLNIESFINLGGGKQDMSLSYDDTESIEKKATQSKSKWCFDISNNSMDIIINNYREPVSEDLEENIDSVIVVPSGITSDEPQLDNQMSTATTPKQTISVDCFSNRAVKFKCDHPNCKKGFWSEEKLTKHKTSHNRQVFRTPQKITIECPVKKTAEDGSEEKCPRTFKVRGELLTHLNEDHTLEDAQYRCTVCGRRFFWASGLRAHGASVCARGVLACAWPGCGRVFRLPCRLREHARAHTGDRPYHCRYPECGWAFRSASKLMRHARRHTGERRHACGACGRAFRRREHLREHHARHHQPAVRPLHHCTHAGCEQTFTNMSTLYMHMKKVHRKVEQAGGESLTTEQSSTVREGGDNVHIVSVMSDSVVVEETSKEVAVDVELGAEQPENAGGAGGAEGAGGAGDVGGAVPAGGAGGSAVALGAEWHAARTHCTWPLSRPAYAHYVLDDDVQVERTEGSSSDVYTVRSDLFLHGNVHIDEDSQQMVGVSGAPLDADLCLINSHPTIDLMQEELMYEDAAVDESSFRVFLMNSDDLPLSQP